MDDLSYIHLNSDASLRILALMGEGLTGYQAAQKLVERDALLADALAFIKSRNGEAAFEAYRHASR